MKIGMFDSGVGGLFVLKKLMQKYPDNEYIYFGDTINLPYGEKSKDELKSFSDKIIKFLISKEVDIIIIACGTISSNIYEEIKDKYKIKMYDIISPTIKYLNNNDLKNIGVIGTKKTIESGFFKNNINTNIVEIACPKFVDIIENEKKDEFNKYIDLYLREFKINKIDALVFGCTHYPYLKDDIKAYFNYDYIDIDMGEKLLNILNIKSSKENIELYFSKVNDTLIKNVNKILESNYKITEKVL